MKKLVLVIMAQKGGLRMDASPANQAEVRRAGLQFKGTFQEILLVWIDITET